MNLQGQNQTNLPMFNQLGLSQRQMLGRPNLITAHGQGPSQTDPRTHQQQTSDIQMSFRQSNLVPTLALPLKTQGTMNNTSLQPPQPTGQHGISQQNTATQNMLALAMDQSNLQHFGSLGVQPNKPTGHLAQTQNITNMHHFAAASNNSLQSGPQQFLDKNLLQQLAATHANPAFAQSKAQQSLMPTQPQAAMSLSDAIQQLNQRTVQPEPLPFGRQSTLPGLQNPVPIHSWSTQAGAQHLPSQSAVESASLKEYPAQGAQEPSQVGKSPDGKVTNPYSVPMNSVASCPYLVDYNFQEGQQPQDAINKKVENSRIDLVSALNQFIEQKRWKDYEKTNLTSSGQDHVTQCPVMPQSQVQPAQPERVVLSNETAMGIEKSTVFAQLLVMLDKLSAQKSNEMLGTFEAALNQSLPGLISDGSGDAAHSSLHKSVDQEYRAKEQVILKQIHNTQVSLYEQLMTCRLERFTKLQQIRQSQESVRNSTQRAFQPSINLAVQQPCPEPVSNTLPQDDQKVFAQLHATDVLANTPGAAMSQPQVNLGQQHELQARSMAQSIDQDIDLDEGSHSDPAGQDKQMGHPIYGGVPRIAGPNSMIMMDFNRRFIYDCPHTDRRYYAKGMCVNCYHRRGRTKMAWNCPHTRKTHYSKGLCKYCYLASYYKSRTAQRKLKQAAAESKAKSPKTKDAQQSPAHPHGLGKSGDEEIKDDQAEQ